MNQYNQDKIPNIQINENQEFTKKIKHIDSTYTNSLIAKVKVNVHDLQDYRVRRFDIDPYSLSSPLICKIKNNNYYRIKNINIKTPKYSNSNIVIKPFNDYIPFVENTKHIPFGELYYRKQKLTSISKLPKLNLELDDKINMKKYN